MTIGKPSWRGRASAVILDGALRQIPGYKSGGYQSDQAPLVLHNSEALALDSAQSDQNPLYFPFPAIIVSASIIVPTAPDSDAVVQIGTTSDNTHFDAHTLASASTSNGDRVDNIDLSNAEIDAGDIVVFGSDGGSTSSATAHVTLVIAPRQG